MTMEEKYGYEIDKGNLVSTWPEIDFVSLYLLSNVGITPSNGALYLRVPAAEVYSKSISSFPVPYKILFRKSLGNFFIGTLISTP